MNDGGNETVSYIGMTATVVLKEAEGGRGRGGGFSKGLPQSPGWLRIVQVLQGFQGNLDKDRNTLKVNIGESAWLLVDLIFCLLINLLAPVADTQDIVYILALKQHSIDLELSQSFVFCPVVLKGPL